MSAFESLQLKLKATPRTWLVTGVAGFIRSNLPEALLKLNQSVVGMDNFRTGYQHNLNEVQAAVTSDQWAKFSFIKGDIRKIKDCQLACERIDYVLHQAALGSVPRSIEDPITTNQNNIGGFLNMQVAARDVKVKRFVYDARSSTYGDHPRLPKVEDKIGKPLSPYAVTKFANELHAEIFSNTYGFKSIGLRYFNIFGRRQNPSGAYAAVIPKWIPVLIKNDPIYINGDGETSRDFCYIDNAVQINLLAACTWSEEASGQIYNLALGDRTSRNDLYRQLQINLLPRFGHLKDIALIYRDFRTGDVQHSLASISKANSLLGYAPTHRIGMGSL
jgi:UDP-N-acetylglucosamine 4-epimerase